MMPRRVPRPQRGFSIVELLVGLAVGLFVIGGALKLFVDNLGNSRRQVLELRVNQDLRAAADLIARDLRRAAYWGDSTAGVTTTNARPLATSSPHATVTPPSGAASAGATFSYSQSTENNTLDGNENFGFRLNAGAVQYQRGSGNWLDITDTNTLTVTTFTVTPSVNQVPLAQYCTGGTCAGPNCPQLNMRSFTINLQGQSASDPQVVRSLQETIRVRNNELTGVCP